MSDGRAKGPAGTGIRPALALALGLGLGFHPVSAADIENPERMIKGVTRCLNDLSLGFAVGGRMAEVPVTEGREVVPGEVLARLDFRMEELEMQRRKLQWESTAELRAAAARRQTADKQAAAAREIFANSRGVSREEVENKTLAHAVAAAEHDRLKDTKRLEEIDYLTAVENLARRTLRSPSPGIVTKVVKQVGESVQAHETALRLCDLSRVLFTANVPVAQVGGLAMGDQVEVVVGTAPEAVPVGARVTYVSPVVDAASGLREVKVDLLPSATRIHPGLPARMNLGKVSKAGTR